MINILKPFLVNPAVSSVIIFPAMNSSISAKFSDYKLELLGSKGSGEGQFYELNPVAFNRFDNLYVSDTKNYCIQKFSPEGKFISEWGSRGSNDGEFSRLPHRIEIDWSHNIYVTDRFHHDVKKFTADGKFISKAGSEGTGDGQFLLPLGIGVDGSDNLYQERSSIEKFVSDGTFMQRLALQSVNNNDTSKLEDIEIDKYDNIYVTDRGAHNIKVFVTVN